MRRKGPSPMPEQLQYLYRLKVAGVTFAYADIYKLPSIVFEDLILWGQAEAFARADNGS